MPRKSLPRVQLCRSQSVVQVVTKTATTVLGEEKEVVKEGGCPLLLLLRSSYLAQAVRGKRIPQFGNVEVGGSHLNINSRDVKVFQLLGSGRSASVYRGSSRGRAVAVKRMEAGKQSADKLIVRELAILSHVAHPNLVTLLGACLEESTFGAVLELCRVGSLFDLLHDSPYWVTLRQQLKIADDVARGMAYLHERSPPITHRDLKCLNVLMLSPVSDERHVPIAKVADFGMAKACQGRCQGRRNSSGVGTIQWMPPELLSSGTDFATEVDMYAYGVLLYEIVSFEPPF